MSGYLTNLLSRLEGKPAVQPRLNALFGPAIAGPEWTAGRPQENEEQVQADREAEANAFTPASMSTREARNAPTSPPAILTSKSEPDVATTQPAGEHPASSKAGAPERPTAPAPKPEAVKLPAVTRQFNPEPLEADEPLPARDFAPIAETPEATAPQPVALRPQTRSVARSKKVDAQLPGNFQRRSAPPISASFHEEDKPADQAAQPTNPAKTDPQVSFTRASLAPVARNHLGDGLNDRIQNPAPDLRKSALQHNELSLPATRPRRDGSEHGPTLHSEPEPTITVTIGRIEVRAVTPPPPTKSTPRVAPVMSLDDYLRRRSGRS